MNATTALNFSWVQPLAWTLVHFIWQGAAIGVAVFVLLRLARLTASSRYVIGVAALALLLSAPVVTFVVLNPQSAPVGQIVDDDQTLGAAASFTVPGAQIPGLANSRNFPGSGAAAGSNFRFLALLLIVVTWLMGVAALSVRPLGGWLVARRLVSRAVQPTLPEIHDLVEDLDTHS